MIRQTNLVNLRRTIYLIIMSSIEMEFCSQEKNIQRYYDLLGQRLCLINKVYQENFEKCFVKQYSMVHRLEINEVKIVTKFRITKFFAHLLGTDAVLAYLRLTWEDTNSSSRIFIKVLFQELSEQLGIRVLNNRLSDPTMQDSIESLFPKDKLENTRLSINFFTELALVP
ncbi:hypothetical protein UlMin_034662 [Ulmus minor]